LPSLEIFAKCTDSSGFIPNIVLHIFWQESPQEELKEFELNMVAYGLNCVPYLALRVIKEIASLVAEHAPDISRALLKQTYGCRFGRRSNIGLNSTSSKSGPVWPRVKKWTRNFDEL